MSALEASDDKGNNCRVDQPPAGVSKIYSSLGVVAGISHHLEENARVVADESVARKLGEEANEDCDEHTATHTTGAEEIKPGLLGNFHLCLDSLSDLYNFGLDELRVGIALGVVLDQNGSSFFTSVVRDEETGGFWKEARFRLLVLIHSVTGQNTYKTVTI